MGILDRERERQRLAYVANHRLHPTGVDVAGCETCDYIKANRKPISPTTYIPSYTPQTCKYPGCANEAGAYSGLCSGHVMARVDSREYNR